MFGLCSPNKKTTTVLTLLILILFLTTTTPTQAQKTPEWKQEIRQNGYIETGPHGLALDAWTYLLGKPQNFIDKLTMNKELKNKNEKENTASIHAHSLTIKQSEKTTQKIQKNHIKDARNLVWTKIKKQTITALNNNKTKEHAINKTIKAIKNYYSTIQYNLNQQLATELKTIKHLSQKNQNTTTQHKNQFLRYGKVTYYAWNTDNQIIKEKPLKYTKKNITLLNNSKQQVIDIKEIKIPNKRYSHGKINIDPVTYSSEKPVTGDGTNEQTGIISKTTTGDQVIIINSNKWHDIHQLIKEENQRMIDNARKYIEGVYEQIEKNQINTKDLIDASTLVTELNTETNKTGYYGYSGAKLALLGINTSFNGEIEIKLINQNKTLNGLLFTDHVPKNNSFVVNETYYPTNWSESCYFLEDRLHILEQPFLIKSITGYNGTSYNKIGLSNYNHQTIDPNKTQEQLNQLNELYNKTKPIKQKNVSIRLWNPFSSNNLDGISDFGLGFEVGTKSLLLVFVALLFLIVLMRR